MSSAPTGLTRSADAPRKVAVAHYSLEAENRTIDEPDRNLAKVWPHERRLTEDFFAWNNGPRAPLVHSDDQSARVTEEEPQQCFCDLPSE